MVGQKFTGSAASLLLAATAAIAGPSPGCGGPGLQSGVHTIDVNGQQREYTLTLPDNYDPNTSYRLILGVHWWGGSMQDVETGQTVEAGVFNYYGLERLADNTAIFAAPNGFDGSWYNDGGSDYQFINQMLGELDDNLCVEQDLRFSLGFSWGGSTSIGLACMDTQYPFRAIATINPAGPNTCDDGSRPMGYMGIHGTGDNPDSGRVWRDRWIANNECSGEENPQPGPGAPHVRTDYQCNGPPVSWITFDGGHISAPYDGGQGDNGSETFVSPAIWDFFSQF